MNLNETFRDRFWAKVKVKDGCWEWTGAFMGSGYGMIGSGGRAGREIGAHRASWYLHNGEIPEGMHILHKCDNKKCVNPEHLFLGTAKDNMQDRIAKGQWIYGDKHKNTKLSEVDVVCIRLDGRRYKSIADDYGISPASVCRIKSHKRWAVTGSGRMEVLSDR